MTQSQEVLLALLQSYIHDIQPTCDFSNVDWEEVKALSIEHAVAGVVFEEIQKQFQVSSSKFQGSLSTELKLSWYALQQQIAKQNQKVDSVLELVFRSMKDAEIPAVLLKGQAIAHEYRNPSARTSGDIDLFVGRKHYDQTKQLFKSLGWLKNKRFHEDIKHIGFSLNGVEIELHRYGMFIPGKKQNEYLQKLLEEALENTECGYQLVDVFIRTLPPLENLVFTFVHMSRHFIGGGVGLRQIVDVAVLVKKTCTEDFISYKGLRLYEVLKETGFEKAWSVFGYLNTKYLGFREDRYMGLESVDRKDVDKVMEIVVSDGNFGHSARKSNGRSSSSVLGYFALLKSYLRLYKIFPKECRRFLFRQINNTTEKYLKV